MKYVLSFPCSCWSDHGRVCGKPDVLINLRCDKCNSIFCLFNCFGRGGLRPCVCNCYICSPRKIDIDPRSFPDLDPYLWLPRLPRCLKCYENGGGLLTDDWRWVSYDCKSCGRGNLLLPMWKRMALKKGWLVISKESNQSKINNRCTRLYTT